MPSRVIRCFGSGGSFINETNIGLQGVLGESFNTATYININVKMTRNYH